VNTPITGQGMNRVDGRLKVTGRATYAAEFTVNGLVHGVLLTSTVPSASIARMDTQAAERAPGVLAVMTPFNAPRLPEGGKAAVKPPAGRVLSLLQDTSVVYNGQPIGVVIADTLEHATAAAHMVQVSYAPQTAVVDFEIAKGSLYAPEKANQDETDTSRGDVRAALADAPTSLQPVYRTPIEHHNPMEPHATIAAWTGDALTVYDATQYVTGVKETLSKTLGIAPEKVTVMSPFVGGGFGCKGSMWSHVALAAMAAQRVNRPVKLVLERPQMFAMVGNRPQTEQRMALGSGADGRLTATRHDVITQTSFLEDWVEPSAVVTRMLYATPNQSTTHRLAKMNIGTPTFTRAPGEASGSFALESAMDELAVKLRIDPIDLRLRNYAEQDPGKNKPFSSKSLRECYRLGAERFGWARRTAPSSSMRNGRWQVGMGMATATYPANRSAAQASARVMRDGSAVVQSGSQDLGTGTYTVMTQVAADALGIAPSRIRFELGDSRLPKAPVSGGSQSVASVAPAVQAACLAARAKLIDMAVNDAASPFYRKIADQVTVDNGRLQMQGASSTSSSGESIEALLARNGGAPVTAQAESAPGPEKQAFSMHSFGAIFAEVWVDPDLGVIRLPRLTGAYAVGRLLNAKTAHSQLMGGMVWGAGMALFEESVRDLRNGRIVNGNLAEYHVPVNADIGAIDIAFVPEDDPHVNPLGAKGIGEIGITGVAGAIGNAVYHATGKRIRDLPITLDKLLRSDVDVS
jgi:xanthine dehydrogenase YagR molybdenum-binding subunit